MDSTCRTCLKVSPRLCNIFDDATLPHKIETISSVLVSDNDHLPSKVCDQCIRNIHLLFDFRCVIIKSDLLLRQRIKNEIIETKAKATPAVSSESIIKVEDLCKDEIIESKTEIISVSVSPDIKLENVCKNESNPKSVIDNVNLFKCSICQFTCLTYFQWKAHKRTHIVCQKAICNMCGKSIRKDNIRKHIMTHTEPPVQCQICGKTCKNTESLRGHLLGHKITKLQCNTCEKSYRHRAAFAAHLKRHLLGDKKTVECSICSKLFFDNRTLKKHIRSHTGERPYLCSYCKKGFSSSNARNTHVRQHTNEKPFACQFCPSAFPQKVSLKTHLKSKHPDKQEESQNI